MSDDFRDLLERSADKAPPLSPNVVSNATQRGRVLHRRRRTAIGASTFATLTLVALAPLAFQDDTASVQEPSTAPSAPAPTNPSSPPAPSNQPGADGTVRVYVIVMGSGVPYLGLAAHDVKAPDEGQPDALRAVQALLDTPEFVRFGFAGAHNGWARTPDTALRATDVQHVDGIITVELRGPFGQRRCDPCAPGQLVIRQMVKTAQHALQSRDPVIINVNGHRLHAWDGQPVG